MSEFLFSPVLGWTWLILLAVVIGVGALVTFFYGLRSKLRIVFLWTFRAVALALFVVMMTLPQRRHEEVTVLKPQLAVLVDTSESMADPVDESQPRRSSRVAEWMHSAAFTNQLADFDVRVFTFDQSLVEAGNDPSKFKFTGDRSNLIGALRQAQDRFRGQPLAAICLLSDGIETVTPMKTENVSAPTIVPVYTFELEKPFKPKAKPKEVGIMHVDYPGRVVVGWDVEVKVSVRAASMAGQTVVLELWRDGNKLTEMTVAFGEDEQTRDAVFTVSHDHPAAVQYEARLADPSAKKDTGKAAFVIDVIEPGNRVLYLQNTLSFDFKFLRKAIEANRNLQLAAFVRWKDGKLVSLTTGGRISEGTAMSFSASSLARYAVVIIGNLPPDSLTQDDLKNLRDYTDKGGGLVVLGGPGGLLGQAINTTPMREVLPMTFGSSAEYREGAFPVAITDIGLHHPVFGPLFAKIHEFQPLQTLNIGEAKPGMAEVLVRANCTGRQVPLVTAMKFGKGRVLTVATDTIYGWRLAEKGWTGQMSPYDTFWAQLMDWLIPKEQEKSGGNKLDVFTDRANYLLGEKPEVRAIVSLPGGAASPKQLPLTVTTPDEKKFEYIMQSATLQAADRQVPGYRVAVDLSIAGVYVAEATAAVGGTNVTAQARFVVTKPPTEVTGQAINRELLQRLSETSKGKYLPLGEWNNWRKNLHVEEQHFSRVQLLDLWNHPFLLGLLLAVLAVEWIARKLWSLP